MIDNLKENISYKIFCSNADVDGTLLKVPHNKWVNYNSCTQVWYASKKEFNISLLKREIEYCRPQILFINGIYSWYFNIVPLLFCNAPKKILSVRGMLHPGALKQKAFKKSFYLFLFKLLGIHLNCEFHACDDREKTYILNTFGGKVKIHVAQNFPKFLAWQAPLLKKKNSLLLISVALISPMKNILTVLLALKNLSAQIVYHIYGSVKDEQYWKKCLEQIENLPSNIIVKYHGDIQREEVKEVLSKAHVFILPSKSENFGHAIFEALSAGKPVITTNNTPWKHLQNSKAGVNVNDEVISLQNAISLFSIMGHDEYCLWSKNAAEYAASIINPEKIKTQYKRMFNV